MHYPRAYNARNCNEIGRENEYKVLIIRMVLFVTIFCSERALRMKTLEKKRKMQVRNVFFFR